MKLSKTSWLIIIIGIFVIALSGLGVVRAQQVTQQTQLKEELTLVESRLRGIRLGQLSTRQLELEQQLSQATSQSEAVKAILAQPAESVVVSGILFDIAEAYGLEVTRMTSSSPVSENLEGIAGSVISLSAVVEGNLSNLIAFITRMNNQLATGFIRSAVITIPETDGEEKVSADIELVVYAYQGD